MAKSADPSSFLTLQMATVDDEAMEQLSQRLLSENCSITALDLSYNAALGKEGLAALARGLSQNTTVSALNLAGCKGITDRAAADFARTLRVDGKGTCKLSKVNFSGCQLGDQFAKQVGACLEPSYPPAGDVLLGSVNLSGCESLTDEGLVAMVKPLAASPSLNSLDLHGCILLTDSGFAQLAKRLRYNISLEYLDLSWCELLSDLTAQRLAEALEENRALKTLRLACCVALTNDGAISLATALQDAHGPRPRQRARPGQTYHARFSRPSPRHKPNAHQAQARRRHCSDGAVGRCGGGRGGGQGAQCDGRGRRGERCGERRVDQSRRHWAGLACEGASSHP